MDSDGVTHPLFPLATAGSGDFNCGVSHDRSVTTTPRSYADRSARGLPHEIFFSVLEWSVRKRFTQQSDSRSFGTARDDIELFDGSAFESGHDVAHCDLLVVRGREVVVERRS